MKSRISCFDTATFKKDITRFVPLWALYAVGLLLIMLSTISGTLWSHPVRLLDISLEALSLANLLYGALCAQLLFGELFNSRLCNALHAMPVTRSARFVSHICAGLLFAFVPNLLVSALMMPYLGQFWYIALLWLGAICLQYVFFFGVGVLSVMCTGSRFAMVVVYAIINFLSLVVYWFTEVIFLPMMDGVLVDENTFLLFCPVSYLVSNSDYIRFSYTAPDRYYIGGGNYLNEKFVGFGEGWLYLFILAAIGIAALAGALLLYRRRKLESAGDFMAVKWLGPIFLVLYTLCAGAFLSIFGELFGNGQYIVFLIAGLIIGFFTGRMLLERTIRVFRKKNFLQLGILTVAMLLSLWVVHTDLLGIVSYVPDPQDVAYVVYDSRDAYDVKLTSADDIEKVCEIHQLAVDDYCDRTCGRSHLYFNIEYHMKDGRVILRQYYLCSGTTAHWLAETLPKKQN